MYSSRDRRGSGRSLLPVGTAAVVEPGVVGAPAVPPESLPVPPPALPTSGDDVELPAWAPLSRTSPVIVPVHPTLLSPKARPRPATAGYRVIAPVRTASGHRRVSRCAAFALRQARIPCHETIPARPKPAAASPDWDCVDAARSVIHSADSIRGLLVHALSESKLR